ncbi:MAG: hypothetical protein E7256_14075 [Lachnospiraceae bacterium]|nr:hypothetical protein [Lachnospiraceae bacterium]
MSLKKSTYMFKGRSHSRDGLISMAIGIAVVGTFSTISFLSGKAGGNGSMGLGAIGLTCFVGSIWGFLFGIKSFKDKDIYYAPPIIGLGSNGIMMVVLFTLYIIGILS